MHYGAGLPYKGPILHDAFLQKYSYMDALTHKWTTMGIPSLHLLLLLLLPLLLFRMRLLGEKGCV